MSGIVPIGPNSTVGHNSHLNSPIPQQSYVVPPSYPSGWIPGCQPQMIHASNYPHYSIQTSGQYPQQQQQQQQMWHGPSHPYAPSSIPPLPPVPQPHHQQPLSPSAQHQPLSSGGVYSGHGGMPQHASSDCQVGANRMITNHQHDSASVSHRQRSSQYRGGGDDTAWLEDATAVTGATSETGLSGAGDNFSRFGARYGLAASLGATSGSVVSGAAAALIKSEADDVNLSSCSSTLGIGIKVVLSTATLLSPLLMLILPHFPRNLGWLTNQCTPTCEGYLIGISVKLILLLIASWLISFPFRPLCGGETVILPRIRLCRTLFSCLIFVALFAFWLFYAVRVIQPRESDYLSIVLFAGSLTDTLLFLHFTGIAMLELRRFRPRYAIHIVRSPDGESRSMKCGSMSVQRAAMEVLQFYMTSFTAFNASAFNSATQPHNTQAPSGPNGKAVNGLAGKRSRRNGGSRSNSLAPDDNPASSVAKALLGDQSGVDSGATALGGGTPSASSRLYDEIEYDKRKRKRRMRLLLAVEEAFTHVRRLASTPGNGIDLSEKIPLSSSCNKYLDPYEAAQAVFPTLIRPLQKYMRVTRQQARHPVDSVIDHLALCLAYNLSPHAFLERFNPSASTPQLEAASAATALEAAQLARKQLAKPHQLLDPETNMLLNKQFYAGGQQAWSIVADRALSRSIDDGAVFQLRRGSASGNGTNGVSLICTVRRLPLIRLVEAVLQPLEAGRFVLTGGNSNAV